MKKYTQLTYEQRYSIHLLNKDTVKLLRQVGEKWVADDCSYLCKGLLIY
jgi:hypothetical protein